MREPFAKAFNLPERKIKYMTWPDMYDYSDALLGEVHEGTCPNRYNFTQEQWYHVREIELLTLVLDF